MDFGIIFTCDGILNATVGFSAPVTVTLSSASWVHSPPLSSWTHLPFQLTLEVTIFFTPCNPPSFALRLSGFSLNSSVFTGVYVNNHISVVRFLLSIP